MKKNKSLYKLLFWIALSITFNIYIFFYIGEREAIEFFGGYILEMSLSLDNLFLFLMIFSSFNVPSEYQERVLKYGILGAMILRLIFILLGVSIINKFNFIIYIFGIILFFSGIHMFFEKNKNNNVHDSNIIRMTNKFIPVTDKFYGNKFFKCINKKIYATPLLVILLIIEGSDVIFAMDSIPAIFSITRNTFIIYTSNIFAILGLRSMYYILARMNNMFKFMKYGVAFILMFTGIKLLILYFNIEISIVVSILIIMIILLISILFSLLFDNRSNRKSNIKFR
ncbi:hypothetical protein JCM1393_26920 [Clostridium carnis]